MDHQVPNRNIYKYRNFQRGFEIVLNNELFFDDPRNFQDINDCSINLVNFTATDEDITTLINANGQNRKEKRAKIRYSLKHKDRFETIYRNEYDKLLSNVRISCFSTTPLNDKMWIEYGDKHTGICLHFDSRIEVLPIIPYNVMYCDPLPCYNYYQNKEGIVIKTITTKSKSKYNHEQEVRLFHFGSINKIKFDSRLLISIICGEFVKRENIETLQKLIERQDLRHVLIKHLYRNDSGDIITADS